MEIKHLFIILISCLLLAGCWASETVEEPKIDNTEAVEKAKEAAAEASKPFCGDGICQSHENKCTCFPDCGKCEGQASATSRYVCENNECIVKSDVDCGDGKCHETEIGKCLSDCPVCDDKDKCTADIYKGGKCTHEKITPCCGDGVCSPGESTSCIDDCGSDFDLSSYPEPFVIENQFNTMLIIGEGSGAKGVVAGTHILSGLDFVGQKPGYTTEGLLDTDMKSLTGKNAILIGNPCMNSHVLELYQLSKENCGQGISPNEKIIKLFKTGASSYALVVSGYNEDDVREASKLLEDWENTNMKGVEYKIK